jgi:hypothetical protein
MSNLLFVTVLGTALGIVLRWAFRHLPGERWQFVASVPVARTGSGGWEGLNLTYYGVLSASAYTLGAGIFLMLMSSIGVPLASSLAIMVLLLGIGMPASRWVARLVEGKLHTFTVGGASFVGLLLAPWAILLLNAILEALWDHSMPVQAALASLSIAYAFGEGVGRLACISFGCCYGRSLADSHPILGGLFKNWNFTFAGDTKKIAYAGRLDGQKVIPIQAVTAVCYVAAGLIAMTLFLGSFFGASFLLVVGVTQSWRALSELLRADYRGDQPISAYQIMAVLSIAYSVLVYRLLLPSTTSPPDIILGLKALWDPGMLLLLQLLWVASFLYTGRSRVTGSMISFHVVKERI